MKINAATKIAALLKHHPDAMKVIIGLSPKFEKLKNPLLRKLLAGRTSIAMASKIGGCEVNDFFNRLRPLGFIPQGVEEPDKEMLISAPDFLHQIDNGKVRELDVRPILEADEDPLKMILTHLKELPHDQVLRILNTFEPTPLVALVSKKGYSAWTKTISSELTETYIYKEGRFQESLVEEPEEKDDWQSYIERYEHHMVQVDVRQLPMPQPMMVILETLDGLPLDQALFVLHKKVPVFLLPEIKERGYDYRMKEVGENEVHLLIFKEENDGD